MFGFLLFSFLPILLNKPFDKGGESISRGTAAKTTGQPMQTTFTSKPTASLRSVLAALEAREGLQGD